MELIRERSEIELTDYLTAVTGPDDEERAARLRSLVLSKARNDEALISEGASVIDGNN